ncbi:MAG: hypothetical protein RIS44_513 [Pseudomonadota bacterium]|jgi:PAS domain S-box-containing protein
MNSSILIVEDEAVVALDLQAQLEDMGYTVVGTAATGLQALALARSHRPQLILMDVRLKGDMDGISVAQTVARELGTPVVFLTSYSDNQTVDRAAQTAPYGYLTKPFQIRELRAVVEVALAKATMERQLKESERWFARTLRCVQDSVIVTEADARIRFLNLAAETMTGWSQEEAKGHEVNDILRFAEQTLDGQPSPAHSGVERVLESGEVVGAQLGRLLQRRDKQEIAVDTSVAPIDDEAGQPMGAVVILRDAKVRLDNEARLRASEERFRDVFNHAPLGMALLSTAGRFLQVNAAFCKLLGKPENELLSQTHASVTDDQDQAHELLQLGALQTGHAKVVQFEKRYLIGSPPQVLWALVSVSLLQEQGLPSCYLYQVHDLTEQKRSAERLAELAAERMRREASELVSQAKDEFLARVSHEMRTPLNAVLGFAQLLQMQHGQSGGDLPRFVEQIVNAGHHLTAMVDDLLDIQQATAGRLSLHLQNVTLENTVRTVIALLQTEAQNRHVQLVNQCPVGIELLTDETRLRQILLNLASNAIKYNKPDGKVIIVCQQNAEGSVVLTVADTGLGMTPAQIEGLFRPFERLGKERTSIPGVGLGLVISRRIAESLGGQLTVKSVLGEGTQVLVTLPASKAPSVQS